MRLQYDEFNKSQLDSKKQVKKNTPNVDFLRDNFSEAIKSFYITADKIIIDNPVDTDAFLRYLKKVKTSELDDTELALFLDLKKLATSQGKAIGAVIGFFLKYDPYSMLAEIRQKQGIYQPLFGPVVIADHDNVTNLLSRHEDFTVDLYGEQMCKAMSHQHNGGYDSFILGTDDNEKYVDDKYILSTVVNQNDVETITQLIHVECQRRLKDSCEQAQQLGDNIIDVVPTVARFIPVFLVQEYLGIPYKQNCGQFDIDDDVLKLYDKKVCGPDEVTPLPTSYTEKDGAVTQLPDTALSRHDGVIPDQQQIYNWIVACFKHFFNNVQKNIKVQVYGVRAYRELLVYILRIIKLQKEILRQSSDVKDTMLSRLLKIQLGLPLTGAEEPMVVEPSRVSDLRIAENIMGIMVGAVAGQEEATCRVIDSMIRLKEGGFLKQQAQSLQSGLQYANFEHACRLAHNVVNGEQVKSSRTELLKYVFEALRLQPQGEVLLRQCIKEGATIGKSRPMPKGTLLFVAHGSAMKDIEQPDAFILGRPQNHYLHYGYGRHKCLGQYVSPILMLEALIAILQLKNVRRPLPGEGETAFPQEHRFGHFQLDGDNLYAKTFSLEYDD